MYLKIFILIFVLSTLYYIYGGYHVRSEKPIEIVRVPSVKNNTPPLLTPDEIWVQRHERKSNAEIANLNNTQPVTIVNQSKRKVAEIEIIKNETSNMPLGHEKEVMPKELHLAEANYLENGPEVSLSDHSITEIDIVESENSNTKSDYQLAPSTPEMEVMTEELLTAEADYQENGPDVSLRDSIEEVDIIEEESLNILLNADSYDTGSNN